MVEKLRIASNLSLSFRNTKINLSYILYSNSEFNQIISKLVTNIVLRLLVSF